MRTKAQLAMAILVVLALAAVLVASRTPQGKSLHIALVDVEGGGATLIVTPAGQAVLIDSGWPGNGGRDANRILATAHELGVRKLDYVITTHFHQDHYGSLTQLSRGIPIGEFIDHGLPGKPVDEDRPSALFQDYARLTRGRRHTARPGETLPLWQINGQPPLKLTLLGAASNFVQKASAPENPECAHLAKIATDTSDNANSVVSLLEFGSFRYFDGGDLTWNMEAKLVCPRDQVGHVTVYQVNHHGLAISSNPVLLSTLHPMVAIENNGPRKGGEPATFERLRVILSPKDIYQLHRNLDTAPEMNTLLENIANVGATDTGYGVRLTVDPDAESFVVLNERNGKEHQYRVQP